MELLWFAVCAFLFSAGDYYSSLAGVDENKPWMPLVGAFIGAFAYIVFGHLSKTTPLAALGGYINGAVVCITCVYFGWFIQGNKVSTPEWLWLGVILAGIAGLAYARSSA